MRVQAKSRASVPKLPDESFYDDTMHEGRLFIFQKFEKKIQVIDLKDKKRLQQFEKIDMDYGDAKREPDEAKRLQGEGRPILNLAIRVRSLYPSSNKHH